MEKVRIVRTVTSYENSQGSAYTESNEVKPEVLAQYLSQPGFERVESVSKWRVSPVSTGKSTKACAKGSFYLSHNTRNGGDPT